MDKPCIPGGTGPELIRQGRQPEHFYCAGYRDAETAILKELDREISNRDQLTGEHSQIAVHTLRTFRQNIERRLHRR